MRRVSRLVILLTSIAALSASWPGSALAQRGRSGAGPHHRAVNRGAVVFVGGYFYDPFFGPYSWWPHPAYPYRYYPVYDDRAVARVIATPKDASVYVDGFYAGTVHDFNDSFQGLPLTPGGHDIVLFFEGFRTVRQRVYLAPGSTVILRHTMERVAAGETSEPPSLAPPIPAPPVGSYMPPRTPPRTTLAPRTPEAGLSEAFGTLALRVQPENADVWIDGERWTSSDGGRFVIQLSNGQHHIEAVRSGYQKYSTDIQVRDGETTTLNVGLMPERP